MQHESNAIAFCLESYESFRKNTKPYVFKESKTTKNLDGCAEACRKSGWCKSISFRNSSTESTNCLLYSMRVEDLNEIVVGNTKDIVKVASVGLNNYL